MKTLLLAEAWLGLLVAIWTSCSLAADFQQADQPSFEAEYSDSPQPTYQQDENDASGPIQLQPGPKAQSDQNNQAWPAPQPVPSRLYPALLPVPGRGSCRPVSIPVRVPVPVPVYPGGTGWSPIRPPTPPPYPTWPPPTPTPRPYRCNEGPRYWCLSVITAIQCGRYQWCQENIMNWPPGRGSYYKASTGPRLAGPDSPAAQQQNDNAPIPVEASPENVAPDQPRRSNPPTVPQQNGEPPIPVYQDSPAESAVPHELPEFRQSKSAAAPANEKSK